MPKISIKEIDNTGVVQQSGISNVVYFPLRTELSPTTEEISEDTPRYTDVYLCSSTADLEEAFGKGAIQNQLDYGICKHLINIGFQVAAQGWVSTALRTEKQYTYNTGLPTDVACQTGWWKVINKPAPQGETPEPWPSEASALIDGETVLAPTETDSGWEAVGIQDDPLTIPESKQDVAYVDGISNLNYEVVTAGKEGQEEDLGTSYIAYALQDKVPASGTVITEEFVGQNTIQFNFDSETSVCTYYYENGKVPSIDEQTAMVYCVVTNCAYTVNSVVKDKSIADITGGVSDEGWDELHDKGVYDIRFLTHGLFAPSSKMIDIACQRGDCIALVNLDESVPGFSYKVADVRAGFEALSTSSKYGDAMSYAAAFTPWFTTRNSDIVGDVKVPNDEDVLESIEEALIPAAYGYLFGYANSLGNNNPEWYAVAGFKRGIIPELYSLPHIYSSADIEILQARGEDAEVDLDDDNDNVGIAINPIAFIRPAGNIIWGNRTMHNNDSTEKTKATSFLNVRNGVSAIKKVLYTAARKYTFEQNSELLWLNFQAYTTPLLDRMQSGNGILGYRWQRLSTPARARLKAKLIIVPIEAVEDFELEVYLENDLSVSE